MSNEANLPPWLENPPTREAFRRDGECRHRGGPTKADVWRWPSGPGSAGPPEATCALAVKDVRHKPWWGRWWGRRNLAREWKAYRALDGLPGLPRPLARLDADAIALEWIEGAELIAAPARFRHAQDYHGQLSTIIDGLHDRGWVHLDLRGRHNVLLDQNGRVVLIDLGAALRWPFGSKPPGWLCRVDRGALVKWKRTLLLPLRLDEWRLAGRGRFWSERWWPNPKRRQRKS